MSLRDLREVLNELPPEDRAYLWHSERDLDELGITTVYVPTWHDALHFGIGFAWGAALMGCAWWVKS